jgi:hypothetical protein
MGPNRGVRASPARPTRAADVPHLEHHDAPAEAVRELSEVFDPHNDLELEGSSLRELQRDVIGTMALGVC